MPSNNEIAIHFFLQIAVILVTYRLLWWVFRRLGQVQVVAIMVAGFVLGPSLLGTFAPAVQNWLFPQKVTVGASVVTHPSLAALYVVGQLGLVLYMFIVGMSFHTKIFNNHIKQAAVISAAGILPPVIMGGALGWLMVDLGGYFPDRMAGWQGGLFVAAAVAVTAFPMLAWIVYDSGLLHTRIGTMALACAATDDAVAWILLAGVISTLNASAIGVAIAIGGAIVYVTVMLTAGRVLLRRVGTWADRHTTVSGGDNQFGLPIGPLIAVLLVMLVGAWFTDVVGVYSVFGAFVAGTVMPRGRFADTLRERIEPITAYLLLPAFFVYSGLNTDLTLLFEPALLGMLGLVLLVSFVGKGLSVALAARVQGMDWYEALSLGSLMNARGLMELILLNIGLNAGIVSPRLYTILAIMTIVTTFAATPLHNWIQRRRPASAIAAHREADLRAAGIPNHVSSDPVAASETH